MKLFNTISVIYSIFLMKQIDMLHLKTTKMTSWAVDAQEVMRSTLTWVKKKKNQGSDFRTYQAQ